MSKFWDSVYNKQKKYYKNQNEWYKDADPEIRDIWYVNQFRMNRKQYTMVQAITKKYNFSYLGYCLATGFTKLLRSDEEITTEDLKELAVESVSETNLKVLEDKKKEARSK